MNGKDPKASAMRPEETERDGEVNEKIAYTRRLLKQLRPGGSSSDAPLVSSDRDEGSAGEAPASSTATEVSTEPGSERDERLRRAVRRRLAAGLGSVRPAPRGRVEGEDLDTALQTDIPVRVHGGR